MNLDPVHDSQKTFRALLEAFSFPGKPVKIGLVGGTDAVGLAASVLIDGETPWALAEEGPAGQFVTEWSGRSPGDPVTAAFLVVPRFDDGLVATFLSQAQAGTLADPHKGATVLVGVDDLDRGTPATLWGPGVPGCLVRDLPTGDLWLKIRNERVKEFPLGIDLVFLDTKGTVLALPRTTRILSGKEA